MCIFSSFLDTLFPTSIVSITSISVPDFSGGHYVYDKISLQGNIRSSLGRT
jgi:hypothetical protein